MVDSLAVVSLCSQSCECATLQAERAALKRGLMAMMKRHLKAGMNKWQHEAALRKHQERVVAGALRRMINRKLSMAFEKWQLTAAELAEQQRLMSGAAKRFLQQKLSQGYNKWKATAAEMVPPASPERSHRALLPAVLDYCCRCMWLSCGIAIA